MSATRLAERELRSVNPATLEVVGSVPVSSADDVEATVERAARAQETWGRESPERRAELLRRVRRLLVEHADELTATVTAETGKPLAESYANDVLVSAEQLAWLERQAARVLAPEPLRLG